MKHLLLSALVALTVTACSSLGMGSKGTGAVMQVGKDSYTVRTLSERSISAAKQEALTLANASCAKQTRQVMLTNEMSGLEEGTGERYYDLSFMCLTQGDTDFQRVKRETPAMPTQSIPTAE